jgi:hypothetical protein
VRLSPVAASAASEGVAPPNQTLGSSAHVQSQQSEKEEPKERTKGCATAVARDSRAGLVLSERLPPRRIWYVFRAACALASWFVHIVAAVVAANALNILPMKTSLAFFGAMVALIGRLDGPGSRGNDLSLVADCLCLIRWCVTEYRDELSTRGVEVPPDVVVAEALEVYRALWDLFGGDDVIDLYKQIESMVQPARSRM